MTKKQMILQAIKDRDFMEGCIARKVNTYSDSYMRKVCYAEGYNVKRQAFVDNRVIYQLIAK